MNEMKSLVYLIIRRKQNSLELDLVMRHSTYRKTKIIQKGKKKSSVELKPYHINF